MRRSAIDIHRYPLELELLTPLHIGAGGPALLFDYDVAWANRLLWVLDTERAIEERLSLEDIERGVEPRISRLLRREEYRQYARYTVGFGGELAEQPRELLPLVRDVEEQPYLPGSSLKGAFRTALAWALFSGQLRQAGGELARTTTGQAILRELREPRLRREQFARRLEIALFQSGERFDPNHDLLRALRPRDSATLDRNAAVAEQVGIYSLRNGRLVLRGPGNRWLVETLPQGTRLRLEIELDLGLFRSGEAGLPGERAGSLQLQGLLRACREFARALAQAEARFFRQAGPPSLAQFYDELLRRIEQAGLEEAYLQLGWGTGWTAKTVGLLLRGRPELAQIVQRLRLDRGRGSSPFPKTRRLVERGSRPLLPLGWVRIALASRDDRGRDRSREGGSA
jgi:CRISPR-associated protein Csm5